MVLRRSFAAVAALLCLATPSAAQVPFALAVVVEGLNQPVFAAAPAGDPRLFVVEQTGTILILENGALREQPFLDIHDAVSIGGERGLLGLAFHPDYASTGRFFVNYTDRKGDTRVVEYKVSADANVADAAPVKELLFVDQPRANHNGGWIGFGPDGLLYVGMGDGGGAGDPRNNAQNPKTLLGKMVRLNVDGGEPEIFLSGVRNPWRNAWDGDDLHIADVGQSQFEEINVVGLDDAGGNLGWRVTEGDVCFAAINCDTSGFIAPVQVYSHDAGCSITGGYVYRGAAIPVIAGLYFYADYCSGGVWSLRYADGVASEVTDYFPSLGSLGPITSFGLDAAGEMYVMTQDGVLRKFVPAS